MAEPDAANSVVTAARPPEVELHSVSSIVQLSGNFDDVTSSARPVKKKLKLGGETLAGGADKDRTSEELTAENTKLKLRILGNPQTGGSSSSNAVCPSGVQVDGAQKRTLETRTPGSPNTEDGSSSFNAVSPSIMQAARILLRLSRHREVFPAVRGDHHGRGRRSSRRRRTASWSLPLASPSNSTGILAASRVGFPD